MSRIVDKFLLFLYSLVIAIVSVIVLLAVIGGIPHDIVGSFFHDVYVMGSWQQATIVSLSVFLLLISLRLFIVSVSRSKAGNAPSIDQRTDIGDIRISMETIENLTLKIVNRQHSVKDARIRIRIGETGLEITIRTIVDGESSIIELTEEIQRSVKEHVEEITGIPVANVTVFVANVIQQPATVKSRVE